MRCVRVPVALLFSVSVPMLTAASAQTTDTCFIDYFRDGQPCVCKTDEGLQTADEQTVAAGCWRDEDERLTRLQPSNLPPEITPPVTPPGQSQAKGNNGIGNDEVGNPPGIGNSGNDMEGVRTAQTSGPGAKGPSGARPGSESQNAN